MSRRPAAPEENVLLEGLSGDVVLPEFKDLSGCLRVGLCPELTSLVLPNLTAVGDALDITGCPKLHTLHAPKLATVGNLHLRASPVTSLEFPLLRAASNILLKDLPDLAAVQFPQLTRVDVEMKLANLHVAASVAAPKLVKAGSLVFMVLPRMQRLDLPLLESVERALWLDHTGSQTRVDVTSLRKVKLLRIKPNSNLTTLVVDARFVELLRKNPVEEGVFHPDALPPAVALEVVGTA